MFRVIKPGCPVLSPTFKRPVYVANTEKGQIEVTSKDLKKYGIDPNKNDNRNWWDKIKDFFYLLKDNLTQYF